MLILHLYNKCGRLGSLRAAATETAKVLLKRNLSIKRHPQHFAPVAWG